MFLKTQKAAFILKVVNLSKTASMRKTRTYSHNVKESNLNKDESLQFLNKI